MLRSKFESFMYFLRTSGFKYTMKLTLSTIRQMMEGFIRTRRKNSKKTYKEYIDYVERQQLNRFSNNQPEFVELSKDDYEWTEDSPKIIAWYLPQYYQMEVNNKYHGQGFTEWTNSSHTMPMFTGHYQPHIPYDVGYYDLLNEDTIRRQAFLAKKYGVYGFAYHWYWFSGERTMEVPPQILLEHPDIDIHYCFDWATENWTSAWDGGTKEVIFEQQLKEGDAQKFMDDILPFMKDQRYIKIEGKPVLSIYRCDMFEKEQFLAFVEEIRSIARENGFPDLYLMLTNRVFEGDVSEWGMDALVEFPPSYIYPLCERYKYNGYMNSSFKADIFDITKFLNGKKYFRTYDTKEYYRSALVGFDNSARRATTGCQVIMNNSPEKFMIWLRDLLIESRSIHTSSNNIIFINSWNEWAEGSHLEPDMRYGYAYLQAVKDALENEKKKKTNVIESRLDENRKECIKENHFYIHCIESMGDIIAAEPIVGCLKMLDTQAKVHWIVKKQYEDIIKFHPYIDYVETVEHLGESIDLLKQISTDRKNIIVDCHYDGRTSPKTDKIHRNSNNPEVNEKTYLYFGGLLQSFCLSAGISPINEAPKMYLDPNVCIPAFLPEKYIVFHCMSAESTKDWNPSKWNDLAKMILAQGYTIVEVGMKQVVHNENDRYINLTSERDLQLIAKIISCAQMFVGVDSGFAHFANSFEVPGTLIFGDYKNFKCPMMYTGKYANGEKATIVYACKGRAENVEVYEVYDSMIERLRRG